MRNSIILNGVKSDTVKGLLIQSLPPITKPLIRTQVEEIDGRDGDVITKLGYSAYNKEMSVGLFGDYNIDEVIKYFDSEGKVIFSNEPDKYYNYQIIDQIDFEKLMRFKTAKVIFHVQPFKYSSVERLPVSNQHINFADQNQSKNGVKLTSKNGLITLSGTATANTEFYIPIKASLKSGTYTLTTRITSGQNNDNVFVRVIKDVPTNANSFGDTMFRVGSSFTEALGAIEEYNFLWVYILANGQSASLKFNAELVQDDLTSISVVNAGNIYSKPVISITGTGNCSLYINGSKVMQCNFNGKETIILNPMDMNAYKGTELANRQVYGDFKDLILPIGKNTISWTGSISMIVVEDYSRWI